MKTAQLLKRNLIYYWRTNLAVVLGVATAVAVLSGALLVGHSVRASLRDLFVGRLGNTDYVVSSAGFFRDQLAADLQNNSKFASEGFTRACPIIALEASVTHESSKRLASSIRVYGVDERFWKFHDRATQPPLDREVLVSDSLAQELGGNVGDSLLLRVQKPSDIPAESLHSRKEDLGRTLRLTLRETLSSEALGDFSVQPQQSATRAVFVPLKLLQRELEQEGKSNLILISAVTSTSADAQAAGLNGILETTATLEDYGVKLRTLENEQSISLEHDSKLLNDTLAQASLKTADDLSLRTTPVLSYLANRIVIGERSIPYSLVTALDEASFERLESGDTETRGRGDTETRGRETETGRNNRAKPLSPSPRLPVSPSVSPSVPAIILNEWAARDLAAKVGDRVSLEYYYWHDGGRLETRTAEFHLAAIVPIAGLAGDRNLVPDYPGISGSENMADWDPPFPVDLDQIRKQDEDYWHQYRTTPKAFISLAVGQQLWQSRFGKLTSIRLSPANSSLEQVLDKYQQRLRARLDPGQAGLAVLPVRSQGLEASRGATDFGEYFLYFSFFLVISALLLMSLFFKLGIEQRLREIGLLQAIGFPAKHVRHLFLIEGVVLSVAGSLLGIVGAVLYGQMMMLGLRTWWVEAVGTTMLRLHVSILPLLTGAAGGVLAALICIVWTLKRLNRESTRGLLAGSLRSHFGELRRGAKRVVTRLRVAHILAALGGLLLVSAAFRLIGQTAGFFGGGIVLLTAILFYQSAWLRKDRRKPINGTGWWPVSQLGFRNTTYRPGRSVLCIALIASAAFIIVSVDAFRRKAGAEVLDQKSGNGGFPLLAESLLPVVHDPNTREGQEALNLSAGVAPAVSGETFTRFRVRPGDDASCLNLYQPRNPKIIAPKDDFIQSGRFGFANSLAASNEERDNPWLLLKRVFDDGAIPVIADANSMTYVLHRKLGEDLLINEGNGPIRLRFVAALADSIFQSELLMSEDNFLRVFPEQEGYRYFLIETGTPLNSAEIGATLEDRLSDYGFDVVSTSERLASFHRVENTYLSTFQMLGGLGLLLGTLGLAAVLLRNVLERRRELALLRAVGYNSSHFTLMVIAENVFLLVVGVLTGTFCALLAIAPVFFERGGRLPNFSLGLLLAAVLVSGLVASLMATWAALRSPLLPALRAE